MPRAADVVEKRLSNVENAATNASARRDSNESPKSASARAPRAAGIPLPAAPGLTRVDRWWSQSTEPPSGASWPAWHVDNLSQSSNGCGIRTDRTIAPKRLLHMWLSQIDFVSWVANHFCSKP